MKKNWKIFEEEEIITIHTTHSLQIFCKFLLHSNVIFISIIDLEINENSRHDWSKYVYAFYMPYMNVIRGTMPCLS